MRIISTYGKTRKQPAGEDESITIMKATGTSSVSYALAPHRRVINLVDGSGVQTGIADNPAEDRIDLTINSTGGGSTSVASLTLDTGVFGSGGWTYDSATPLATTGATSNSTNAELTAYFQAPNGFTGSRGGSWQFNCGNGLQGGVFAVKLGTASAGTGTAESSKFQILSSSSTSYFSVESASGGSASKPTITLGINDSSGGQTTVYGPTGMFSNEVLTAPILQLQGRSSHTGNLFQADNQNSSIFLLDNKARMYLSSTVSTIAAGTGAGTSPTISIAGSDQAGVISLTTGSSPSTSATVATITFATVFATTPRCVILTPANAATAALSGTSSVFVLNTDTTTSLWKITSGSAALTGATAYKWHYLVIG